jgi:hypothetical protein
VLFIDMQPSFVWTVVDRQRGYTASRPRGGKGKPLSSNFANPGRHGADLSAFEEATLSTASRLHGAVSTYHESTHDIRLAYCHCQTVRVFTFVEMLTQLRSRGQ